MPFLCHVENLFFLFALLANPVLSNKDARLPFGSDTFQKLTCYYVVISLDFLLNYLKSNK